MIYYTSPLKVNKYVATYYLMRVEKLHTTAWHQQSHKNISSNYIMLSYDIIAYICLYLPS
jgi:hypothetical protein